MYNYITSRDIISIIGLGVTNIESVIFSMIMETGIKVE